MSNSRIHPTAIIDKEVELGADVEIGAYCVVSGKVRIGDRTRLKNHVTVYGTTTIGSDTTIHPQAVVGDVSQDLKYKGEETEVIIGTGNTIRECATIQQGTAGGGGITRIGDNNLIMAYAHIAHDCVIGSHVIIVNATQIAGHVVIDDYARIEGICGIHQFVTVGKYAFAGFLSRITKDIPPFTIVEGNPARERSVNSVGLQRAGFNEDDIVLIKKAFRVMYRSEESFQNKLSRLNGSEFKGNRHVAAFSEFLQQSSDGKNGRALEKNR